MKRIPIALMFGLVVVLQAAAQEKKIAPERVSFPSKDGLTISADLYDIGDKQKPILLLCHQAGSSRGEYRRISPRLVKAGFSCLAIDQRSGRGMLGVTNLTAQRAAVQRKRTGYLDARQDIEAAIDWIRKQGYKGKLSLWGSSYSSALALMVGASSKELTAVLSFAPGEYLPPRGSVGKAAAGLTLPVLIVSPENERVQASALFKLIRSSSKTLWIKPGIVHGSKTLFKPRNPEPTWKAVLAFLNKFAR